MAVTEGQLISDGTAVWKVKKIGSGELPAGIVQMFAGNSIPAGWLLCDGSAVSRTNYAKLFSAIGETYGAGDGSTTFALPNLIDRFLQGSATAGTYKEAGAPNITGKMNFGSRLNDSYFAEYPGAAQWSPSGDTIVCMDFAGATATRYFTFDASRSNPIYGNSDTIQPSALTMLPIIKY